MKRLSLFYFLLTVCFGLIFSRLFWLQIVRGADYRQMAEENRIKLERIKADRGIIYDRHDRVLARNTPEGREYPCGSSLAHVVGYIGQISEAEWQACQKKRQQGINCQRHLDDWLGKLGIEKVFDQELRGQDGGLLLETKASGEVVQEISSQPSVAGQDIHLTVDSRLQDESERLMKERKGAVIVSDPRTGEILALTSSPSFDSNDPGQGGEMFNRAISGLYPPGSVFKIVTATAGLEEGKINRSTLVEDTGEIRIGEYRYGNWYFDQYGSTEGMVDIIKAIKRSNDIFFYRVGEWLGARKLAEWSRQFGLGQVTGIEIENEAAGLVPDPDWKKRAKGERWFLGNTYHMAIGQGDLLTTPLQINMITNVIAAQGKLCSPYLVKDKKDGQPDCWDLKIKSETLALIKKGMEEVCREKGTAFPLFNFQVNGQEISVAGKTGTSQFGDPQDRTHAWFTAFAPAEDPEISVTVLLEAAGEGSYQAAPVARDLLSWWFKQK